MRRFFFLVLLLTLILFSSCAYAGDNILQAGKLDGWEYLLLPKEGANTLLVYLHGSASTGWSVWRPTKPKGEFPRLLNEGEILPPNCAVLIPHEKGKKMFKHAHELSAMIKKMQKRLGVDYVILSGHSHGANIATLLASAFPDKYDGLISVSGRALKSPQPIVESEMPVLIVHGMLDQSNVSKKTLHSYHSLFPGLNLTNGNEALKHMEDAEYVTPEIHRYTEGNASLLWGDQRHTETSGIFRSEFLWDWIDDVIEQKMTNAEKTEKVE